jgi:hypothetical protein
MALAVTKTVTGLPALLIILAIIGFFIWIGTRIAGEVGAADTTGGR